MYEANVVVEVNDNVMYVRGTGKTKGDAITACTKEYEKIPKRVEKTILRPMTIRKAVEPLSKRFGNAFMEEMDIGDSFGKFPF